MVHKRIKWAPLSAAVGVRAPSLASRPTRWLGGREGRRYHREAGREGGRQGGIEGGREV